MAQTTDQKRRHEKVLKEARQRFKRCEIWEMTARTRERDDLRFCEGDSDNLYQWPQDIRVRMEANTRAMLTINKTKQHCLDIENEARQSRISITIRPTGGGGSFESAQIYEGVVRHVEYISNASAAYQNGLKFAVRGGIGYWRVITAYTNDDSFDQELFIMPINDPFTVYIDPDIKQFDGSDANFAFVFEDTARDEYKAKHPDEPVPNNTKLGGESWVSRDYVRTAEYWRRTEQKDRLFAYPDPDDPTGENTKTARESELPKALAKKLAALPSTQIRPIKTHKVEWFKIVGDEVKEEGEWLGVYIPVCRCVGEETVIDGELDRKGQTRALKDAQRMLNYNCSGSVEYGALQSKTPYTGPADAIEGYETYWETANTANHAYLPFNHRDDDGDEIPAPERQQPPTAAPVYMEGMSSAAEWMRMVSGQYQADMGAPSNERSGAAITARAREGDTATYHFLDHQAMAMRFTAKILLDLIPKVYDTVRVLEIIGEDGERTSVRIDPNQKDALLQLQNTREQVSAIFNPKVGKYEVEADTGPAYQTQRQEAWNAFVQILSQNKDLVHIIGDLAFKNADFPGANEIAERLKRMVPAQALQDGPSPELMQAQQQIQVLHQFIQKLSAKVADKTASHLNDQEGNAIKAYDSQTKRLAAIKDYLQVDPRGLLRLVMQVMSEAEATSEEGLVPALDPTQELNAENIGPLVAPGMAPGGPQQQLSAPGPSNANPQDMGASPGGQPMPAAR